MFPFFIICDGLVLIISGIYGLLGGALHFSVFTGLVLGNITSALNFYIMGVTAGNSLKGGNYKKAQRFYRMTYGLRYIIIFAVYALLITFNIINPVTAAIPLLFPSFYFKIIAIFNKTI
ncbi:MAG: ATP synthase subunit I [Oscillospiraceae bacterium]|nr:ATP synthase subunit I [Oscillospiraceae bacterium]